LGTGRNLRALLPAGRVTLRLVARGANGRLGAAQVLLRVAARRLRVVEVRVPPRVARGARTVTVRVRTSAPSTLRAAGRRLLVGTRLTTLRIPLPSRPAIGVVRVPFQLSARSRSVTGVVTGSVSVVRT
jgi:hypothetical protein